MLFEVEVEDGAGEFVREGIDEVTFEAVDLLSPEVSTVELEDEVVPSLIEAGFEASAELEVETLVESESWVVEVRAVVAAGNLMKLGAFPFSLFLGVGVGVKFEEVEDDS